MKLSKPKTEHETSIKSWGKEEIVYKTENCLGKILTIDRSPFLKLFIEERDEECSLHFLSYNSEKVLYLLKGKIEINLFLPSDSSVVSDQIEEKVELLENQSIKIPKSVSYNLMGIASVSTLLEIGEQESDSEIVRIKEGDIKNKSVPLSAGQFTYWEKHCFGVREKKRVNFKRKQ